MHRKKFELSKSIQSIAKDNFLLETHTYIHMNTRTLPPEIDAFRLQGSLNVTFHKSC